MVSRKSYNFGKIEPLPLGLYALEHLKYPHILVLEKIVYQLFLDCFQSDPFDTCR